MTDSMDYNLFKSAEHLARAAMHMFHCNPEVAQNMMDDAEKLLSILGDRGGREVISKERLEKVISEIIDFKENSCDGIQENLQ